MTRLATGLAACGLLLAALPLAAAPAQARWEIRDLGTLAEPGAKTFEVFAYGINNRGEVVGRAFVQGADGMSSESAVVWRQGVLGRVPLGPAAVTLLDSSGASAINDRGEIAGFALTPLPGPFPRRVGTLLDSNGFVRHVDGLQGPSGLVNSQTVAYGLSAAGHWVGSSSADDMQNDRKVFSSWRADPNGTIRSLGGTQPSQRTSARAVNASGIAVGYNDLGHALRWDWNGNAAILPALLDAASGAFAVGINEAGIIVGRSGGRAVVWEGNQVLPVPGTPLQAQANAINNNRWIVGNGVAGDDAWLQVPGSGTTWVLDLPGVAGSGWSRVYEATAINDRGQFVGAGFRSDEPLQRGFIATLAQVVWENRSDGGSWEDAAQWSYRMVPGTLAHAIIDPTRAITVLGPRGVAEVKRLSVGGASDGGGGLATLMLDGGTLTVRDDPNDANPPFRGMNISARGVLTGDGRIVIEPGNQRALWNDGHIVAQDLRLDGVLVNRGLVTGGYSGTQRLAATFISNVGAFGGETGSTGVIRVEEGERLQLEGNLRNSGDIQVFGGSFSHRGGWLVTASITDGNGRQDLGRVLGQNARLDLQGGMTLQGGQMIFSAGNNNVFGNLLGERSPSDQRGGQIIVTGRSQATFYGSVDMGAGSELRISSGSVATFLGPVRQRSGALFTGSGTKFYEGGLSVGNSPGIGIDEGDVIFAGSNVYLAEIGGTEPGTGHDKLIVHGLLSFGGTLQLVSWAGWSGQVGDRYDLFDWGSTEGQFDFIDSSGLLLASDAVLDFSRLYLDGSIAVTAVPEPGTWALWLAGLAGVVQVARRRRA